jgi:N-ethylmaleimide reductase
MIKEAGPGRVGLKLSPEMNLNDIHDDNPVETYGALVDQLPAERMAYLNVTLSGAPQADHHALLGPRFNGSYPIGGGLTKEAAEALLAQGKADAVVFGGPSRQPRPR